jgi:hypothetical protein
MVVRGGLRLLFLGFLGVLTLVVFVALVSGLWLFCLTGVFGGRRGVHRFVDRVLFGIWHAISFQELE